MSVCCMFTWPHVLVMSSYMFEHVKLYETLHIIQHGDTWFSIAANKQSSVILPTKYYYKSNSHLWYFYSNPQVSFLFSCFKYLNYGIPSYFCTLNLNPGSVFPYHTRKTILQSHLEFNVSRKNYKLVPLVSYILHLVETLGSTQSSFFRILNSSKHRQVYRGQLALN